MPQPCIDQQKCVQCGQCVATCPSMLFEKAQDGVRIVPERVSWCVPCGHCMAVCPTEAVSVPGFDYGGFAELPSGVPDAAALEALLLTRRSVRRFTDEPVSREALDQIVRLAATAPMGVPPQTVEVTVLSTREQVAAILPEVMDGLAEFTKQLKNPLWRYFIRKSVGAEQFDALEEHMLPFLEPMCRLFREEGLDGATWGAPAMLLFHAARRSVSGKENCFIACTYAMLAAHALGLGTTIIGIVPPVVDQSKALRARLGIPEGNECVTSVIVGHPAQRFRRTIPRAFRSVTMVGGQERR